jgi:hypothetical protein
MAIVECLPRLCAFDHLHNFDNPNFRSAISIYDLRLLCQQIANFIDCVTDRSIYQDTLRMTPTSPRDYVPRLPRRAIAEPLDRAPAPPRRSFDFTNDDICLAVAACETHVSNQYSKSNGENAKSQQQAPREHSPPEGRKSDDSVMTSLTSCSNELFKLLSYSASSA